MTSRADFLSRLVPGVALPGPTEIPPVGYVDDRPPMDVFTTRWTALGGEVHHTPAGDLVEVIAAIVAGRSPVLVSSDPLVAGVGGDLRWPECGLAGAATAEVAVVGAVAAIGATGSVVLDSAVAQGRSAALLSPAAVFVVPPGAVWATQSDLWRHTSTHWPDGLPSQVVLVSGPSRSADIEMTLTRGVHGPGEVHAVFLDEA